MSLQPHSPPATERAPIRAVDNPLVRGGLTIGAGLITGNVLGFARVAVTAYLLGTHSRADSLAVAIGPVDAVNAVLMNTMVFAFVPMLTARSSAERTALFLKLNRSFAWLFSLLSLSISVFAPWLIRVLAPGLDPDWYPAAVSNLRILSLSTLAAGAASLHCALLYTDRRFAPAAFYQAVLNLFTMAGALSLWRVLGVYGFAVGYTLGAWVQFAVVYVAARSGMQRSGLPRCRLHWKEILAQPGPILLYALLLALNIMFTRAWSTHVGPGMAAALDYSMRGVGVPLAFLVSPVSNSLLPEIARLRNQFRLGEAFRLIDQTIALTALAAAAVCGVAIAFREPAIVILFQRGSFTADSTRLVSAVFLGLGPSIIGWSLLEITSRSLFALDRRWLPLSAAAIPPLLNVILTAGLPRQPQFLGVGAAFGLLAGFLFLAALARARRGQWLRQS